MYELDPTHFLSTLGLAWQVDVKKTKVKLGLLTNTDMLLTVERRIRGRTCHSIYRYAKAIHWKKDYDKHKESWNLPYWDVNNLFVKNFK